MNILKSKWIKVILVLIGAYLALWITTRVTNKLPVFDGDPIEYTQLATQVSHPFYYAGSRMTTGNGRWRNLERLLPKYPDARACLLRQERNKEVPNLLNFNWHGLGNSTAASICLFRVMSSLEKPELIREWMEKQGLEFRPLSPSTPTTYQPTDYKPVAYDVSGFWSYEDYRKHRLSMAATLGWDLTTGGGIYVYFSKDMEVVGATTNSASSLN